MYLHAQISQTKDPFSVCDDDCADVVLGPVLEDVVHVAAVVDSDKQALTMNTDCTNDTQDFSLTLMSTITCGRLKV